MCQIWWSLLGLLLDFGAEGLGVRTWPGHENCKIGNGLYTPVFPRE